MNFTANALYVIFSSTEIFITVAFRVIVTGEKRNLGFLQLLE